MTDSIISSINQIHKKDIENISKRITEAKNDEKMPLRKFTNLKTSAVDSRIFSLKDLVGELNDRGIGI